MNGAYVRKWNKKKNTRFNKVNDREVSTEMEIARIMNKYKWLERTRTDSKENRTKYGIIGFIKGK